MTGRKAILAALANIETARDELFALFRERPAGWKQQYLAVRGANQADFGILFERSEQWLAGQGDTADARRFRELLAKLRAAISAHRSEWPVVNIVPDDPAYLASMTAIDQARLALVSFVHAHMTG